MFAGKVQNKYMWWAVIFGVCLVVPTAYLGVGSERVFAQVGFDFEWLYVVPELLVFIAISEGYKWIKRAYFRREAKKRLIAAEV